MGFDRCDSSRSTVGATLRITISLDAAHREVLGSMPFAGMAATWAHLAAGAAASVV